METPAQIMVSHESSIMTGSAPRGRGFGFWILMGLMVSLLAILGFMVWFLTRPFPIANSQGLVLITTPRSFAQVLKPDQRKQLPTSWQSALNTQTHWPMVLVVQYEQNQWRNYAYIPRWLKTAGLYEETFGFVKRVSPEAKPPADQTAETNYLSILGSRLRYLGRDVTGTWHTSIPNMETITFEGKGSVIETNLTFTTSPSNQEPIRLADISLNLIDTSTRALADHFSFAGISVDDLPLDVAQINIKLNEQQKPLQTAIILKEVPNPETIGRFLAVLGIAGTKEETLPDGSTSLNRVNLSDLGTEFTTSTPWGELHWSGRELTVGQTQPSPNPVQIACPNLKPVLRLSNTIYPEFLLPNLSNEALPALQLGNKNGKLTLCLE